MPEMQPTVLGKSRFTYTSCRLFSKNKARIQKFKETWDSQYIYQNKLHKSCFQHDTPYGDVMDLPKRTASDIVLRDKAFQIAKSPKDDRY